MLPITRARSEGTVWAWLIGPFVDAWIKIYPEDRVGARRFLEGMSPHLNQAGIGTLSEVFDAEPPYTPSWLHRPGLVRGRGAEVLGQDRPKSASLGAERVNCPRSSAV